MQRSSIWIFQGSPEIWDVSGGLGDLRHWVVRQHKEKIRPGDKAYIWESGKSAGIVATATIKSLPNCFEDTQKEVAHYPSGPPPNFKGMQLRVELRIDQVFEPRIKKSQIQSHGSLSQLLILRNPRGTNFSLTDEQADALEQLVCGR